MTLTDAFIEALRGRYQLERELGRGGMATVYLARDLKHDRPVAIKVLRPDLATLLGPERFLREIRLTAQLQHPNILNLLDSGESDGFLFYVMPYVEGESLRERLRREVQLPMEDAVSIAREVAEALDLAHRRQILHRDIKPENILLSSGHALVADFGIAKALGDADTKNHTTAVHLTETGMSLGTPAYMSPEQASGEKGLDCRSDVYSLGCVLYEMLSGEPPFAAPSAQAMIARRLTESAPPVRRLRPQVPAALERVVERSLASSPADRFRTAGALAEALASRAMWMSPEEGALTVAARPVENSVAVLPFTSLSPDPENEYFADGMTDELINALAKVSGLHVVSRTSAFAFKGKVEDARAIGARLRVQSVLEGSIRRAGQRLRLTAQLIDVSDGFLLWSDTFDRQMQDVFDIQDEISRAIAGALKVKLLGRQQEALVRPATNNLEAYTLYLKGRLFWNRRTEQALWRGLEYFQQAIELDPSYAQAHAGVADSYAILGFYSALPPHDAFPKAKAAALKALASDPTLAEAHPALAYVEMYHEWDWVAAEKEFRLAIGLNPGYATAHQWYGNYLTVVGRFNESVAEFGKALALDPLSPLKHAALGWGYYFARHYDEAVAQCRRALELDAGYVVALLWLGLVLQEIGDRDEAVTEFEEAVRLSGRNVACIGFLGHAYAVAGRTREARELLEELMSLRAQRYVSPFDIGMIHLGLGERDLAISWLERAYDERDHQMVFLNVDPRLDVLRSELAGLIEKMGFGRAMASSRT